MTQSNEWYQYRSFLETLLSYCSDAAACRFTNSFLYPEKGDMLPYNTAGSSDQYEQRWIQSNGVQLYGRLHCNRCNVSQYLLPGVQLNMKLMKTRSNISLMNKTADSKNTL